MVPRARGRWQLHVARVLFLVGLTLILVAMVGGRGAASLPVELPLRVARVQQPGFLDQDLAVAGLDYYGRHAWVRALAAATNCIPLEELLVVLYFVQMFVLLAGVYHLGLSVSGGDDRVGVLSVALLAVYPHTFLLGHSAIYGRWFYEAWLSTGLLLFALSYAVRNQPWPALLITGLSTNLHLLQGVHTFLVLVPLLLWLQWRRPEDRRAGVRNVAAALAVAVLCALPEWAGTIPRILGSPGGGTPLPSRDIVEIVGRLRYGHHFIPAQFELRAYLATAIVLWLGFAAALGCRATAPKRRAALLLGLFVGLCALVAPFIESHYVLMYFDVFRAMKFAFAIAAVLLATLLVEALERDSLTAVPAAGVALLWFVPMLSGAAALLLLAALALRRRHDRRRLVIALGLGLPLVGLTLLLPDWRTIVFRWYGVFCESWGVYLAWILAGVGLVVLIRRTGAVKVLAGACLPVIAVGGAWLIFKPLSYRTPHPQQALFAWIRSATPADAVFITPPTDLAEFRYFAQRPLVAEMWIGPLQPARVWDWYTRLDDLAGGALARARPEIAAIRWQTGRPRLTRLLAASYRQLDADRLRALGRKYGARYCVMPAQSALALPVLYRDADYQVLELASPPAPSAAPTALDQKLD